MSEPDDEHPDGGAASQALPETVAEPAEPAAPALREDHLQNAVAFLSHPKVRSSGAAAKRDFLERKGLTEAEIEEAFRRVPQQPPSAPSVPSAAGTASGAAAPSAVQSTLAHLQPQAQQGPPPQQLVYGQQPQMQQQGPGYGPGAMVVAGPQHVQQQQQGVRWTQAVLGAGFLAASAYAAKSLVWPYVEGAYHNWRGHVRAPPRPALTDGDAAASVQATQAMAEAIAAQTAELRTSIDSIRQLVTALEASQKAALAAGPAASGSAAADGLTVSDLRQELRSFAETLQELASPSASPARAGGARVESELGEIKGLLAELLRSPRSSGSHQSSPSRLPQPQGGKAAGGSDEAGTPVSAHGQHRLAADASSSATTAPRPAASADGDEHSHQPAANGMGQGHPQAAANGTVHAEEEEEELAGQQTPQRSQQTAEAAAAVQAGGETPNPPPHPASYMEVLEMLEKGQTPPGIRTDINDKPPNPYATPAAPKLKPRPKPWEKGSAASSVAGSLPGGAGGSSSSLASLGAASAPAPAAPAAAWDHEAMPAVGAAVPADGAQLPADATAAEPVAQQGLSPVRAPSPAEEAGAELAASAAEAEAQGQQQQEEGREAGRTLSGMSSFHSPKRATSIFDAVAPSPSSPHIIAGRLSPARSGSMRRSGSSSSLGGAPTGQPTGQAAAGSSSLPGGSAGSQAGGGTNNFNSLLAAAQERASAGAGSVAGILGASGEGGSVLEGSGIGRPISRNWRPPPIPAPTLGSGGSSGLTPAFSAPAAEAGGGARDAGHGGVAAHPAAGGGMANGQRAVSAASLGDDFASA